MTFLGQSAAAACRVMYCSTHGTRPVAAAYKGCGYLPSAVLLKVHSSFPESMTATTTSSAPTSYSLHSTVYSRLQPLCILQSQSLHSPPPYSSHQIDSNSFPGPQSTVYSLQSTVYSLQSSTAPLPCRLQTTVSVPHTPSTPPEQQSTVSTVQQTSQEYSSFPTPST